MALNSYEKKELRKYLLKEIPFEETDEIEEKLMVDEKYFEDFLQEEEELIQDYADNNLTNTEREDFEKNFMISAERQKKVKFAQALRKYLDRQKDLTGSNIAAKERRDFRAKIKSYLSPLPIAVSLAAIGLVSILVWHFYPRAPESQAAMASLNRAYRIGRPLESRITGFDYAPFSQVRGEPDKKFDARERNRAEAISQNAAADRPNADNLHTLARLYLAKGDFVEAISEIEKAQRLDPQNAEILSDTGTIYLEQSKIRAADNGKTAELAAKALEYFDKAISINPNLLEARFNRAAALQILNSPNEARKAWQDYLNLDADSQWAEEARQNLKQLDARQSQSRTSDDILRDFLTAYRANDGENAYRLMSRNREMISGKLIPQQLAFLFLKTAAAQKQNYLAALEYAGNLEKEKSADPFFFEIAKFYAATPAEKQTGLSEAQDFVREGYELCLRNNNKDALEAFTRARDIFIDTGDVWEAEIGNYWIGYCLNRLNKIEESRIVLDELANFCTKRNYKWLAAQSFSWQANNESSVKEFSKAIEYNERALGFAKESSDLYLSQKSFSQLADTYRRAANCEQAVDWASKTLAAATQPDASRRQTVRDYNTIAGIFFAMKFYAAADTYQKESLALSIELNEPTFIFTSFINSGRILGAREKYSESLDAFEKARQVSESFDDELKKKAVASINLQTAQILRQSKNCDAALKYYNEAVSFYEKNEFQVNLYDAHKGRLLCYYLNKDDSAFQNELPVILSLFRDYRTKILEEQNRNSFFDNEQSVYDIAISSEYDKRNYRNAFDYSEESRARSLLDLQNSPSAIIQNNAGRAEIKFAANVTEPLPLTEIQAKMPAGVQILQYSVLSDKTLIWLITKDDLSVVETAVSATDLEEKVSVYLELLEKNDDFDADKRTEISRQLYRILIAPIENKLNVEEQLCLIPDKILFRLPFAALVSPEEEKYFVNQHKFFFSPSANIFLIDSQKAEQLQQDTAETVLSVGNPAFNQKDFPELSNLESSAREAKEISAFYQKPILLTGKNASKEKFKENLPNANVIHFAGHYLPNENSPLLSSLIFAENEQTHRPDDSVLANREILSQNLSSAKLIVLSACQTGGERFYNGEGMTGAARTFLATGVPLVVASQWKIDSEATAELMIRFHRFRTAEKLSTADSLRRAQLEMATGENKRFRNPYYWAGFEVLGGYAAF